MNKNKRILFFLLSILILVGVGIYFVMIDPINSSIDEVDTDIKVSSKQLTNSFLNDENASNTLYKGKIIEVTGIVKDLTFLNNRNTVILQGGNQQSGVLCDMQSTHSITLKKLKKGQRIKIKGVCKGFLKDVILLNCILTNQ